MVTRISVRHMRGARAPERRVAVAERVDALWRQTRDEVVAPSMGRSGAIWRRDRGEYLGGYRFDESPFRGSTMSSAGLAAPRMDGRLAPDEVVPDLPDEFASSPALHEALKMKGRVYVPRRSLLLDGDIRLPRASVRVPVEDARGRPNTFFPLASGVSRGVRTRLAELYRLTGDLAAVHELATLDPLPRAFELDAAIGWVERARSGKISVAELLAPILSMEKRGRDYLRLWQQLHDGCGWSARFVPMGVLSSPGDLPPVARARAWDESETFTLGLSPFPAPTLGLVQFLDYQWYWPKTERWAIALSLGYPQLQLADADVVALRRVWATIDTLVKAADVADHLQGAGYRLWMRPWRSWLAIPTDERRAQIAASVFGRSPLWQHPQRRRLLAFLQRESNSIDALRRREREAEAAEASQSTE